MSISTRRLTKADKLPPSAVRNVSLSYAPGDDHAILSWSAPAFLGKPPITGYLLARDDGGGVEGGPWSSIYPASTTSLDFILLKTGIYTFSVTPINARGNGPTSAKTITVTTGPTAPAPATAAGYKTLIFNDDFESLSTIDLNDTGAAGYKWYVRTPFDLPDQTDASCFTQGSWTDTTGDMSPSVLTITQNRMNWNQALYTVHGGLKAGVPGTGNGFATQYGYFEARICFLPNAPAPSESIGWPAWWSLSKRHLLDDNYQDPALGPRYFELDFMEYFYGPGASAYANNLVGTIHDWQSNQTPNDRASYGDQMGGDLGDTSQWHIYGCLWKPGTITWYVDGVQRMQQHYSTTTAPSPNSPNNPVGTFGIADLDTAGNALALGTGNGFPMHIDWVRVWR